MLLFCRKNPQNGEIKSVIAPRKTTSFLSQKIGKEETWQAALLSLLLPHSAYEKSHGKSALHENRKMEKTPESNGAYRFFILPR